MKKMNEDTAIGIKESDHWKRIVEELDYRIDCEHQNLLTVSKDELELCQVRIQELTKLKNLPQDVIDRETA